MNMTHTTSSCCGAGGCHRAPHGRTTRMLAVDITRRVTVQGTVKALEWTNPHVWVWIVGDDGKGGTATYGFEGLAPSELTRFFGWTKRSLSAGDEVTVEYAPFKNGDHGGALSKIIFTDGRVLLGRRVTLRLPVRRQPHGLR